MAGNQCSFEVIEETFCGPLGVQAPLQRMYVMSVLKHLYVVALECVRPGVPAAWL